MSRFPAALALCAASFVFAPIVPALAQPLGIQWELLGEQRDRPEGGIRFCLNPDSLLVDLDRAIGEALAEVQLLDVDFVEVEPDYSVPLDYILALDEQYFYIHLYSRCDAILGFAYPPAGLQSWLTLTRPYLSTRDIAITTDPDARSLADIPASEGIGTRLGARGDGAVLRYSLAREPQARWQRRPYNSNIVLFDRLVNGLVPAAVVWEPAFVAGLEEGLIDTDTVRVIDLAPVPEASLDFGIVMLATDTFIRTLLDEAIVALSRDGTIARLIEESGFPAAAPME